MLIGLKTGDIKVAEAAQMQKLAAQINESFYSEIKVASVRRTLGDTASLIENGELRLAPPQK
jgi:hypothetical protein